MCQAFGCRECNSRIVFAGFVSRNEYLVNTKQKASFVSAMVIAEMEESSQKQSAKLPSSSKNITNVELGSVQHVSPTQHLHRKLRSKEVQLFAIGGAIGVNLFVQMGSTLPKGGPAGLLLGFVIRGAVVLCGNECFGTQYIGMSQAGAMLTTKQRSWSATLRSLHRSSGLRAFGWMKRWDLQCSRTSS